MRLFAIAARAVCVMPEGLDDANLRLEALEQNLVAPESKAAAECLKLWRLFARVAQVPKETLRLEAAKALCQDLDALGQRLDLPPLADWEELPQGLDDPHAFGIERVETQTDALTLTTVRQRAKALFATIPVGTKPALMADAAAQTATLVSSMPSNERRALFTNLVGRGILGRSDVNLLIRFLIKGDAVQSGDTTLIDVLERVGRQLAQ